MDKILVAEDDASLRMLIKSYLKSYEDKFETIAVENGLEAIKTLQNEMISLLVTDIKMPKVEGLVLLAYMNRNFPKVPCGNDIHAKTVIKGKTEKRCPELY
ncbi:MAG: response regulator [Desulfobacteraceae bacterium]|nr:response regulator [Desulfobacteraceae bacterium]